MKSMSSSDNFYQLLGNIQDSNNSLASASADKANAFTWNSQMEAQRFNATEAQKNRDFQLSQRNTAHQAEVQDLIRAGLNPVLSANNGASVTSGATASIGSSSGQKADLDMQKASLYSQWLMNKMNNAQAMKINKMNNKNALKLARIGAAASMYGADASASASRFGALQAAGASMYGSQLGYQSSIYGIDKQFESYLYGVDKNLEGTKYTADNNWDIANLNTGAQKFIALINNNASMDRLKYEIEHNQGLNQMSTYHFKKMLDYIGASNVRFKNRLVAWFKQSKKHGNGNGQTF